MKKLSALLIFITCLFLIGCSGEGSTQSNNSATMEYSAQKSSEQNASSENKADKAEDASSSGGQQTKRMVVYEGSMSVKTKEVDKLIQLVEEQVAKSNGYIVESSIERINEDRKNARLFVRIPKGNFDAFLNYVGEISDEVMERSLQGKDVTEEYVDLESRLKAKRIYEERLLTFLKNATKTEDLLKISKDLSQVQSEIEQIEGRMNYLQNRSDFASLTIHIYDSSIDVPQIGKQGELNTIERIKSTFMSSINGILQFLSAVLIFIIGLLPVWIILGVLALIVRIVVKKRNKNE